MAKRSSAMLKSQDEISLKHVETIPNRLGLVARVAFLGTQIWNSVDVLEASPLKLLISIWQSVPTS